MELKTSEEWEKEQNIKILDPDGWRTNTIYGIELEPCDFYNTKIPIEDFKLRLSISTIIVKLNKETK